MEFSPDLAKKAREALGLSRVAAAKQVGLSRQGLINIEDGGSAPSVDTLARIAAAYRRDPGEFFITADAATSADGGGKADSPETNPTPADASQRSPAGV